VFSDGMVMQRSTDAAVWGWGSPGEIVTVEGSWGDAKASTKVDTDGRWMTRVPTGPAGGPYTLTISGSNTITIQNVLLGEVWICSGQSNMEWPMARVDNAASEIEAATFPEIRLFDVARAMSLHERADVTASWAPCSPDAVRNFSGVAYYFGRRLHEDLGVPIGLISTNWGGTRAEAWTSAEALASIPHFSSALEYIGALADPNTRLGLSEGLEREWWQGLASKGPDGWMQATDVDWTTVEAPRTFEGDFASHDGVFFARRVVNVPASMVGKAGTLSLCGIDDRDDTFINGTRVGSTYGDGQWNSARRYTVPAGVLKEGANVISIVVLDTGGAAGFNGDANAMQLTVGDQSVPVGGAWKVRAGPASNQLPALPAPQINQNTPTVLYNGMIAPLVPYSIQGAIWYQGESNRYDPILYREIFQTMIKDWRQAWGQGDFPFYFVQIAPYTYRGDQGQTALTREAQNMALALPNTGMAVTMDIGNPGDIHPTNKRDVGDRLARWALNKIHGKPVVFSGPIIKGVGREENRIRVQFHFSDGLQGDPGTFFEVAGPDRVYHPAQARLDQESIVVWSDEVANPVAVRYAWDDDCQPNLRNGEGLPMAPFRTDNWD
ncbi:MAG: hypothetical protein KDA28_10715, partial [Phycisphaerales bacterium]|nr:hypothetical protein [Phycisphaerales bacterium]